MRNHSQSVRSVKEANVRILYDIKIILYDVI